MKRTQMWIKCQIVAAAVGVSVFSLLSTIAIAEAQFSGQGLPGRREGAGTRGQCVVTMPTSTPSGAGGGTVVASRDQRLNNLMSVIPESNIGATLSDHPTFFWYVPANTTQLGQFTLYDGYGSGARKIYETRLDLKNSPGVVSFKLPSSAPPLELERTYHWRFRLVCDPTDRSGDLLVEGFVQRVQSSVALETRLKQATERQLPTIYAAAGIWHETVASLVALQQANPNDATLRSDWNTLLQTINLEYLVNQPITPCCEVMPSTSGR